MLVGGSYQCRKPRLPGFEPVHDIAGTQAPAPATIKQRPNAQTVPPALVRDLKLRELTITSAPPSDLSYKNKKEDGLPPRFGLREMGPA